MTPNSDLTPGKITGNAPGGDKPSPAQTFTVLVRGWNAEHKGRLATLRRNAGEPLAQARGVTWMYDLLNDFERGYGDETLFLTATLLALDRPYLNGAAPFAGSFGRTLAVLKNQPGVNGNSLERRFAILLDADFDRHAGTGELPFRLRQTVKLIVSKAVGIDWPRLLEDLSRWNDPNKAVQKRWAKDFYAPLMQAPTQTVQTQE